MHIGWLKKIEIGASSVYYLSKYRADEVVLKIEPFLIPGEHILDLGSGTCNVAELLIRRGFKVTMVDIADQSFVPGLHPILYDGQNLPFRTDAFDVVILVDVLHHAGEPLAVLSEARRAARRLIVMETIYHNRFQWILTLLMDMLCNFEFLDHSMNHASDAHWKETFRAVKLRLEEAHYARFWKVFQGATYCLSKLGEPHQDKPIPRQRLKKWYTYLQ